jgi:acetolactate synthase-1/2/3 large subunit
MSPEQKNRCQDRFRELSDTRQQWEACLPEKISALAKQKPISSEWLSYCINEVVDEDTIVLSEAITSTRAILSHLQRSKPGTLFAASGSSLGWGLGAALGVKLAAPDKTVVSLMGDGCFIFGCPTAALWASHVYNIPILCVIIDNGGYNAVRTNLRDTFGEDNYAEKDSVFTGLEITQSPDYTMIARADNAYSEIVEDPGEVKGALIRALEQVRSGRTAVLDIKTSRE